MLMFNQQFTCKRCKHRQNNVCLLTHQTTEDNLSCAHYTDSPYVCQLCGNHILQGNITIIEKHLLCNDCASNIGTCITCELTQICTFRTDNTIKEPPVIPQTIRQGNTVMQTQIKNPARVKLTCEKCSCYINGECLKEAGIGCEKHKLNIEGW